MGHHKTPLFDCQVLLILLLLFIVNMKLLFYRFIPLFKCSDSRWASQPCRIGVMREPLIAHGFILLKSCKIAMEFKNGALRSHGDALKSWKNRLLSSAVPLSAGCNPQKPNTLSRSSVRPTSIKVRCG